LHPFTITVIDGAVPVPPPPGPTPATLVFALGITLDPAILHQNEAFTVEWRIQNRGGATAPARTDQFTVTLHDDTTEVTHQDAPVDALASGLIDAPSVSIDEGLPAGVYDFFVTAGDFVPAVETSLTSFEVLA
jgi:hypothetical protein